MAGHYGKRLRRLKLKIPELFDATVDPMKILYVGARPDRLQCALELAAMGHELTLLEIVKEFADHFIDHPAFQTVHHGDVRNITAASAAAWAGTFDVVFWWHGPEHLEFDEIAPAVVVLETIADQLVVLASPFGRTREREFKHPGQKHLAAIYPEFYQELGYSTDTIGRPDAGMKSKWSHIMAWKWLNR